MTMRDELLAYVKEKYSTEPDHPWDGLKIYAVLRHNKTGKWYGLLMQVPNQKLGLDGQGNKEIINLKCNPDLIEAFRGTKGYLPGYHMNKRHWITILLDGTVPIKDIYNLIDASYDLTK